MTLYRIYAPASEQALTTEKDLKKRYGKDWKILIKGFWVEKIESEDWFKVLLGKK